MIAVAYEDILSCPCVLLAVKARAALLKPRTTSCTGLVLSPEILEGFRDVLGEVFHSKCGFCERRASDQFRLRVMHYRPCKPFTVTEDGVTYEHPGYYWLAYEWYNLILGCEECAKGILHEFPVNGVRLKGPPHSPKLWRRILKEEEALVLNPYEDDPTDHIAFNSSGYMIGFTEKGQETIRVCALNRDSLMKARDKVKQSRHRRLWRLLKGASVPATEEFSAWLTAWLRIVNKG
jgi:hypothetical protein